MLTTTVTYWQYHGLVSLPSFTSFIHIDNQCETVKDRETCIKQLNKIQKNQFSIHGLWPSNSSGILNPYCNTENNITAANITDSKSNNMELYNNMSTYWVSYNGNNEGFWAYEYNKHGHCYNMRYGNTKFDFNDYFNLTLSKFINNAYGEIFLKAFYKVSDTLIEIHKKEIDNILQTLYPGIQYKLICRHKDEQILLSEIYIVYDLDFAFLSNYKHQENTSCGDDDDYISIIFK
jgi:ribonuclease I